MAFRINRPTLSSFSFDIPDYTYTYILFLLRYLHLFTMEISEIIHQDQTAYNERPFECKFEACRKSFGKYKQRLAAICSVYRSTVVIQVDARISSATNGSTPTIDLTNVSIRVAIAVSSRYVKMNNNRLQIWGLTTISLALGVDSASAHSHRRKASCMRVSSLSQDFQRQQLLGSTQTNARRKETLPLSCRELWKEFCPENDAH